MASWTWLDIVQLWMAALAASLTLVVLQLLFFYLRAAATNTKVFWLLPYSDTVAGMLALARDVAKRLPLFAIAVYVIPSIALAMTLYWIVGS